jgi:murein DD-endopeptidase MepM/ murein hydrolase activator NlpD
VARAHAEQRFSSAVGFVPWGIDALGLPSLDSLGTSRFVASAVLPVPTPVPSEAGSDALDPPVPPAGEPLGEDPLVAEPLVTELEGARELPAPSRRPALGGLLRGEEGPRSRPIATPRPPTSAAPSYRAGATPLPAISSRRREPEGAPAAPRTAAGLGGPGARHLASNGDASAPPPGVIRPSGGVYLSPRMTAIFGGLFGLATLTSVIALLIQVVPPKNERAMIAASASPSGSGSAGAPSKAAPAVKKRERVPIPGPWRVAELEKDASMSVIAGTMNRRSLMEALNEKGVPKAQVYRVLKAFDAVRKFDKSGKKDRFVVAMERESHRVKAFEYELSPSEIWQTKEGDDGLLRPGEKLDLKIAEAEVTAAFYVGSDLTASYQAAGLEDGILQAMDEALSGRLSSESFEEGGTVRVIAIEETALGLFSRYKRIVAMEYRSPDPATKPVRIYTFNGQEAKGYWDERGKQPYAGGWRSPVPGAPITSRFNPKRMHPVLHKIMPHQGTDFGAPTGTPIYAAYRGVIETIGPLGPCGNAVQIQHPNNIVTGYCHLSRFAPALKAGDKVGTHRLIGYVGTTGRSTGPHLHFFAKKAGVFFDAETLQLDGERPVPTIDRQGFLAAKGDLDRRLEAIALPEPPPEQPKPVAAASVSADAPEDAPAGSAKEKVGGKDLGKGPRPAVMVGSPAAIASAAAEPGIHPKGFIEDDSEDDEADPGPVTPPKGGAPPPDEDDDEP